MRTNEFEEAMTATLAINAQKSWDHFLQQQHPKIKLLKQKSNTKYADREYKSVLTIEVPTLDATILVTICATKDKIDFYYFGITKDDSSDENLLEIHERYKIMKALGAKV
jgi:preprotein translocase subunit SecB